MPALFYAFAHVYATLGSKLGEKKSLAKLSRYDIAALSLPDLLSTLIDQFSLFPRFAQSL